MKSGRQPETRKASVRLDRRREALKRMMELREQAIAGGAPTMTLDEINAEVARRRAGVESMSESDERLAFEHWLMEEQGEICPIDIEGWEIGTYENPLTARLWSVWLARSRRDLGL